MELKSFQDIRNLIKVYLNSMVPEERKKQIQEIINNFLDEQKKIILMLDSGDVEHIFLYNSFDWKRLMNFTFKEIISNPEEFEVLTNNLKLNTLERNHLLIKQANKVKEGLDIIFGDNYAYLATIEDFNQNRQEKFFGIIEKGKIDILDKLIKARFDIVKVITIEKLNEYLEKISEIEQVLKKYTNFFDDFNSNNFQANKLIFSDKCENQIKHILSNNSSLNNCDELQLSLYMMIFSQYFDDKNPLEVSEQDIDRIMKRVWKNSNEDTETGKIYMSRSKYDEYIDIFNENETIKQGTGNTRVRLEETRWILSQIRNSIMHGSFEVFEENGEKLINVYGKEFKSQFKFECLIDICEELFKSSKDKNIPDELEQLLLALKEKDSSKAHDIFETNKLDLFDLYINSIFSYNEDLIHKKKDIIFDGISEITEDMKTDKYIGHIRNSVVHRYRELDHNGEIVIKDGENKGNLSYETRIGFYGFRRFLENRNVVKHFANKLNIDLNKGFLLE